MLDDLRSGLRQVRRNPGFAAAAILTLALGVGATTAVFTLADPMLFRPLPFPESDRIVDVTARRAGGAAALRVPDFVRAEATHRGFEAIASFGVSRFGGRVGERGESVLVYRVSRGFFDVLRVRPMLGRTFLPGEYQVDEAGDAAIITAGLWQSAFGGRPDILDQPLDLQSRAPRRFRIVGVLPREFVLPDSVNEQPDVFVADKTNLATQGNRNTYSRPIARLAPGVTIEAAAAEMQEIIASVERDYPAFPAGRLAAIRPLQHVLFGEVRTPLLMLLSATGCVLVLACANLAHLLMARLAARRRELGVRLAIGASRWQLMRMLMTEAAIVAAAGAAAALLFGQWTFDLIMARTPRFAHVYRVVPAGIDWRVAMFAAALAASALVIFGAIPAYRAARTDVRDSLQTGSAGTGFRRTLRTDAALIFVQCAVAIALLVTGALLVRSFVKLAYQPLGFAPEQVSMIVLELPAGLDRQPDATAALALRRQVYERLRERFGDRVTLAGGWPGMTLPGVVQRPDIQDGARPIAYPAAGTFFDVFGMRLLRGRFYDDAEAFGNAPVAVIDALTAQKLWPGEEAIGRTVVDAQNVRRTVVGVVETLRTSLVTSDRDGSAFVPFGPKPRFMDLAIRTSGPPIALDRIRAEVLAAAPGTVVSMRPYRPFERTLGQPRFLASLLGTLGLLTIALTIVGIFGVVNHEVARRTREVGIRMALGAGRGRIRRMIVRRAFAPAVLGVMAGIGASLWWTRTLRSLLFGLEPNDLATFLMSASLVVALVLAASLRPAWRASRVAPVVALRME